MRSIAVMIGVLIYSLSGCAQGAEHEVMIGVEQRTHALLLTPDSPGPHPGILVLETSRGLQAGDLEFARLLVSEGYVCLVPSALEHYNATESHRFAGFTVYAEQIYADLLTGVEFLKNHDQVAGSDIGAIGFSNGGYFAAWLAATHQVAAAVSYYGALSGAGTDKDLSRFRSLFSASSAPILLFVGTADDHLGQTRRFVKILHDAGSPVQAIYFPDAEHEFERADLDREANKTAKDAAWPQTLSFFSHHLTAAGHQVDARSQQDAVPQ